MNKSLRLSALKTAIVVGALCLGTTAYAADVKPAGDIDQLRELIQQQREALDRQEKALENQRERLEALEARVREAGVARVQQAVHVPTPYVPRNYNSDRYRRYTQGDTAAEGTTSIEGPSEPKAEERPEVAAIADVGGVLLAKGRLVIEPSVNYVRSDVNRAEIAGFSVLPGIIIGNINVTEESRNTVVSALTARYGLTNRLEMEVKIPHVWRDDTTTSRPLGGVGANQESTSSANGSDIGDIEFAAHYQINQGGGGMPYFVANLRGKSRTGKDPFEVRRDANNVETQLPTGTGFWAMEPSLTVIYPTDPAVLYANINYLINFERKVSGFGNIDPGNAFGINFGMGIALNEKLSFSLGYDHKQVQKTRLNGIAGPAARTLQVGRLLLGGSFRPAGPATINVTLGVGVTEDSPDLDLVVRIPMAFDLFK